MEALKKETGFLWKGFSAELDATLSVALIENDPNNSIVIFAVVVFVPNKEVEICSFTAEFEAATALANIESGEFITKLEHVAFEYMYRAAERESEYCTKQ